MQEVSVAVWGTSDAPCLCQERVLPIELHVGGHDEKLVRLRMDLAGSLELHDFTSSTCPSTLIDLRSTCIGIYLLLRLIDQLVSKQTLRGHQAKRKRKGGMTDMTKIIAMKRKVQGQLLNWVNWHTGSEFTGAGAKTPDGAICRLSPSGDVCAFGAQCSLCVLWVLGVVLST